MTKFEEAMTTIEDNGFDSFKTIWNTAVEECAKRADQCGEKEIAYEFREYVKEK